MSAFGHNRLTFSQGAVIQTHVYLALLVRTYTRECEITVGVHEEIGIDLKDLQTG